MVWLMKVTSILPTIVLLRVTLVCENETTEARAYTIVRVCEELAEG